MRLPICLALATLINLTSLAALAADLPKPQPGCQDDLAGWPPAAYASKLRPAFATIEYFKFRVRKVQETGTPYLTSSELEWLDRAVDEVSRGTGDDVENRKSIAELVNHAEDSLVRDFRANIDRVERILREHVAVVEANGTADKHVFLPKLLARLTYYRNGISLQNGGSDWVRAKKRADTPIDALYGIPSWIYDLRTSVVKALPVASGGNFEFANDLDVLGPLPERLKFKSQLEHAYTSPRAIAREVHHASVTPDPALDRKLAWVPDLGRALSIFTNQPTAETQKSRVILKGTVLLNGVPTVVCVRFDSRTRFFAVLPDWPPGKTSFYYQLIVGPDGRLEFLDEAPVPFEKARRRLELTHFAY